MAESSLAKILRHGIGRRYTFNEATCSYDCFERKNGRWQLVHPGVSKDTAQGFYRGDAAYILEYAGGAQ